MEKLDKVIDNLSTLKHFRNGNPVSEVIIKEAEKKLEISFSPQYRYFLNKYGYISGEGYEILGIIDNDFTEEDVVGYNLELREDEEFNRKWIVFHDLAGESVAFDYNRINENQEPIVFYNLFTTQRENVAEDFITYLERLYEEVKNY